MLCRKCNVDKLSNEFPPENLEEECDHPMLICLRCVVGHVKDKKTCPYSECEVEVDPNSENMKWFEAILAERFKEYKTTYTPEVTVASGSVSDTVNVTLLNGESKQIPFYSFTTVADLKKKVVDKFGISTNKQKLIYDDKELPVNGESMKLTELNIKPHSTIYLVVLLFAIPEKFNNVVFNLYWGYPSKGRDYLDASCLVFNGQNLISVIDYRNTRDYKIKNAIQHSGDVMNDHSKTGHHVINVQLKKIPQNVTHLFFTLSAWSCPNISKYPNPSLKFYETSNPTQDLCKTTFSHAKNSQAVVMCSVSKGQSGQWEIFESGQLSAGNAMNYSLLKQTIQTLISKGF